MDKPGEHFTSENGAFVPVLGRAGSSRGATRINGGKLYGLQNQRLNCERIAGNRRILNGEVNARMLLNAPALPVAVYHGHFVAARRHPFAAAAARDVEAPVSAADDLDRPRVALVPWRGAFRAARVRPRRAAGVGP